MKRLLLCYIAAAFAVAVMAATPTAYDFSVQNEDGIDIFYAILDETTVEVATEYMWNATASYCGLIRIPSTVDYDDTTFTVVGIGDDAFNWCYDLTEVVLPETITYIGKEAFYCAEGLTTINFPEALTNIGDYAFWYTTLNEATLPEGVVSIGEGAFGGCLFDTFTIPNSVVYMGIDVFDYCIELRTVTFGTGMTYVPNRTFTTCENLETVYLPDCITAIGDYAFSYCTYMPTITLPNSIETIGDYAFDYCVFFTPTSLPSNLKYIGDYAFEDCFCDEPDTPDVSLTIPEGVTHIGEYAFAYCYHLTEVTILANIDTIATRTFTYCQRMTTIDIPKTVTLLEKEALNGCRTLASITSHNPEAPICDTGALSGIPTGTCIIYVPKGAKEAYAASSSWGSFTHIEELDEEETPNVDEKRFEVDGIYYYITDEKALTCEVTYATTSFNTYAGSVVIPETVTYNGKQYAITGIGYSAFRDSENLTNVTIPENITYIDTYAFYNCTALKGVSLPHSITEIGEYTFYDCTGITTLTIPANVTYIGTNAFYGGTWDELILEDGEQTLELNSYALQGCTIGTLHVGRDLTCSGSLRSAFQASKSVSEITFSERITSLCDYEFYDCGGFKELVVPGHITTFGGGVFSNCYDLQRVTISKGITTLGKGMFGICSALKEVLLPEGITDISSAFSDSGLEEFTVPASITAANEAFYDCSLLKKAVLSEGITTVSERMFRRCTALENITLPSTLTTVEGNAFDHCTSLEEVILPEGTIRVSAAFSDCTNLAKILLPQSITSLQSFQNCTSLKKIVIPKQITTLGAYFLSGCTNLEEVIVLGDIESCSFGILRDCSSMKRLYSLTLTPPAKQAGVSSQDIFGGLDTEACVLYVPVGAKTAYENDENWSEFTHIEELGEPLAITYGTTALTTDYAEITGYIAVGSVAVEEVGFEYWSDESAVKTVTATVDNMVATLTDLPYATTYTYRAYAKTANGTIYGDELTFTTEGTNADSIEEVVSDTTHEEATIEGYYTIGGQKINAPRRGITIVRYNDGTAKKILIR